MIIHGLRLLCVATTDKFSNGSGNEISNNHFKMFIVTLFLNVFL